MLALLLALLINPPALAYPWPGVVVVEARPGECLWKSDGAGAVWLGCSGRAELREGGDGALIAEGWVWVVTEEGEASERVEITPPRWVFLPIVRR